ncbi:DUF2779 domain-containing protein [Patescibacteria group bacterium]|nr:DUF2779 domain-containing protein [Patescibacteria group bacterium]
MSFSLSKTDYILYRECPKNTWFKIHKPDLYYASGLSDFEKAIIETGNEVELVARKLFPEGKLIEGRGIEAQRLTQDCLSKHEPILFQPAFSQEGFFAAVDILKFDPVSNHHAIFEIKATSDIDEKVHLFDLAFQVVLLRRMGLEINEIGHIHLDPEYKRFGALNIQNLFKVEDVTAEVEELIEEVSVQMIEALEYLSQEAEPRGSCCCIYKGRSNHCSTFKHSNPQVPEYSIHDLARIGNSKKKLIELVDMSIFHLQEIPEDTQLSDIQKNQLDTHLSGKVIRNIDEIREELDQLVFPLYFLDYETFPAAIPRFNGFSPYQQIPFQYSLHVLETPGGELEHRQFLFTESGDPSRDLAESLQQNIGATGSVIVWNKGFECGINEALGNRVLLSKSFLQSVNDRVFDLMDIFKKQHFVHKDFRGSTSIKRVLPVLAPELSYKDLEIHEGGTASQSWNKLTTTEMSPEEKTKIAEDLGKYCERDTYAMYVIWKHLDEVCSGAAI